MVTNYIKLASSHKIEESEIFRQFMDQYKININMIMNGRNAR